MQSAGKTASLSLDEDVLGPPPFFVLEKNDEADGEPERHPSDDRRAWVKVNRLEQIGEQVLPHSGDLLEEGIVPLRLPADPVQNPTKEKSHDEKPDHDAGEWRQDNPADQMKHERSDFPHLSPLLEGKVKVSVFELESRSLRPGNPRLSNVTL